MAHSQLSAFPQLLPLLETALPDRFDRRPLKLNPAKLMGVLFLMVGFGRKGYRRVVSELRAGMGQAFGWSQASDLPSPQAVSQARPSLSPAMCRQAFLGVQAGCTASGSAPVASYGGYRLLAIDGTRLGLPPIPALIEHFGVPKHQKGSCPAPMAGLVQLWDVGRNRPEAFVLTGCDFDERACARELLDQIGRWDLLIGDRGFQSYDLFRDLSCRRRCRFLLRCSKRANLEIIRFVASGQLDEVVFFTKRDHTGKRVVGTPAIPIRLLRVTLPNGEVEILATNLWRQRGHEHATLVKLYSQRWRIETAFREMKVFHALETFSATYPDGIYQEITAIQIFLTLVSEVEALARAECQHRQATDHTATVQASSDHQITTAEPPTDAPSVVRLPPTIDHGIRFNRLMIADHVIHLLRAYACGGEAEVRRILPLLLEDLWKSRAKVRLGRQFPRKRKTPVRQYRRSGA
jgi:hypothetical protein